MRLDATLALFWLSLAISAAAVVLFLWLMGDAGRKTEDGRRKTVDENRGRPS